MRKLWYIFIYCGRFQKKNYYLNNKICIYFHKIRKSLDKKHAIDLDNRCFRTFCFLQRFCISLWLSLFDHRHLVSGWKTLDVNHTMSHKNKCIFENFMVCSLSRNNVNPLKSQLSSYRSQSIGFFSFI